MICAKFTKIDFCLFLWCFVEVWIKRLKLKIPPIEIKIDDFLVFTNM